MGTFAWAFVRSLVAVLVVGGVCVAIRHRRR